MSERRPRIMLSAGETSGDRLGAALARELLARRPELELIGMGGEQMASRGVRIVQPSAEVAVVGLVEVLSRLPVIYRAMKRLEGCLAGERPDLLVPIDFPDFNLRLSARAGRVGVPVVYYVSPQIWAWRSGRVHKIRRLVRRMLVLFPFEAAFYEAADVPVTFVGYPVEPLAELDTLETCRRFGLDPERPIVALLPGSRTGEVKRQLAPMLESARTLEARRPDLQFVLPRAPDLTEDCLAPVRDRLPRAVVASGAYEEVLRVASVGIVAAGTATLDCALAGLPAVVVYRTNALTFAIGRRLVKLESVALPNLIAGRTVFRELLQHDYTAGQVAQEVERLLDDDAARAEILSGLQGIRDELQERDAAGRCAEAVLGELDRVLSGR